MSFVTAEALHKDDLLIIRAGGINGSGTRAVQPEYEDMYFVANPPRDYDKWRVLIDLISMWEDDSAITSLIVYRYEFVEIGRV